jgi:Cyclin, N-terminal domain
MALDQIAAMQTQEESHYRRDSILKSLVHGNEHRVDDADEDPFDLPLYLEWRTCMIRWHLHIAQTCKFHTSTIEIAMLLLDQFVATAPTNVTTNARRFQMASMACLYLSAKIHEEHCLTPEQMATMSSGRFEAHEIVDMEQEILVALKWRVNPPTASSYVRVLLSQLESQLSTKDDSNRIARILQVADAHIELALVAGSIISVDTLSIAITCLHMALNCVMAVMAAAVVVGTDDYDEEEDEEDKSDANATWEAAAHRLISSMTMMTTTTTTETSKHHRHHHQRKHHRQRQRELILQELQAMVVTLLFPSSSESTGTGSSTSTSTITANSVLIEAYQQVMLHNMRAAAAAGHTNDDNEEDPALAVSTKKSKNDNGKSLSMAVSPSSSFACGLQSSSSPRSVASTTGGCTVSVRI